MIILSTNLEVRYYQHYWLATLPAPPYRELYITFLFLHRLRLAYRLLRFTERSGSHCLTLLPAAFTFALLRFSEHFHVKIDLYRYLYSPGFNF
ncbi:hypothetical protein NDU88_003802 [Pleurodeles waltl]|uniref:Uncharacterized protein n=1 Tax=Pleurodeles waltl TaxID=8319 RepID=A0AAV7RHN2_PLEWA|nr:hypothetical protein NDU88_003802 [Pleurodeles waltl]